MAPVFKALLFTLICSGVAIGTQSSAPLAVGSKAGLRLELPETTSDWAGRRCEPSESETRILPPDTEFAKMEYRPKNPQLGFSVIHASIVLSGKDRTSIHRPEVCLTGQGWNIDRTETRRVTLSNGETLEVRNLSLSRENLKATGSASRVTKANYFYWFVGSETTTADHFERILITAKANLIRSSNPRWAYVGLLGASTQGESVIIDQLDQWIAEAVPQFQEAY